MAYYPIAVELAGRPCVVIGGGSVAERKVEGLLAAGAVVTVVSPAVTDRLAQWAQSHRIRHLARTYHAGDLAGAQLAFATTGEAAVNAAVRQEGRVRGVWINAADDPAHCDFILPAVLRRGALTVAVSTGGLSPGLAGVVKAELEAVIDDDYAVLAQIAAAVRSALRAQDHHPTAQSWHTALRDSAFRCLIREGRPEEAQSRLLHLLQAE